MPWSPASRTSSTNGVVIQTSVMITAVRAAVASVNQEIGPTPTKPSRWLTGPYWASNSVRHMKPATTPDTIIGTRKIPRSRPRAPAEDVGVEQQRHPPAP